MNDFINRYRIKHLRVSKDYHTVDYGYNLGTSATISYSGHEEYVEMELPRSAFEELEKIDRKLEDWSREEGEEAYMRRQHPALREAYDKYRMLLELYK
jgi:hypothetical protein